MEYFKRKQNVYLHKTQPSQAKYSIGNLSKSLIVRTKTDLRLQINNILPKLWSLHIYGTTAQATKLTTTHPTQAERRSFLLTLLKSPNIATKRLNANRNCRSRITYLKAEVDKGRTEKRDNIGLITVYKLTYVFSVRGALLNVVMNCGNTPHVLKPPFNTAALPPLSVHYTTLFTDARTNQRQMQATRD